MGFKLWGNLLTALGILIFNITSAQNPEIFWVAQIDPQVQLSPEQALTEAAERKRIKLFFFPNDTIHNLHKFLEIQEPILEIDCFIPILKIIYRRYTYLISTHCGKILKFKNKAPFQPAPIPLASDFLLTLSSLDYLQRFQQKYFFTAYQNYFEQLEPKLPSARTIFLQQQAPSVNQYFSQEEEVSSTNNFYYNSVEINKLINYDFKEDQEKDTTYQRIEQSNLLLSHDKEKLWEMDENFSAHRSNKNLWKFIAQSIKKLFAPKNPFIDYRR